MKVVLKNSVLSFEVTKVRKCIFKVGNDTEGVVLHSYLITSGPQSLAVTYQHAVSPYIDISRASSDIEIHNLIVPGSGTIIVSFYDSNKTFINKKQGSAGLQELEVISQTELPQGTKYIRYTAAYASNNTEEQSTSFVQYYEDL